jgi:hypothetical protein
MTAVRVVTPETLDHLAPNDPKAMRSRRDLVRVHSAMRTRGIVCQGWQSLVSPQRASAPLRILEIGAGDGTLLLGVAQSLAPRWPSVQLTLLDRVNIVSPATLAAYAALGWTARVLVADVLEWAVCAERDALHPPPGRSPPRWDLISAALFLHHFEGTKLDQLLAAIASQSNRFFACEPERSRLALVGSHLVGAIGANAVTREDAVLSVQAGFRGREIRAQWPRSGALWHTQESATGLFSHSFSARRIGAD